jgi:amino acid transporter
MGFVVLCFAEAGSRITLTGGPYAYVEAVFGRYVGFLAGVLLWMLGTTAVAGVSSAFASSAARLARAAARPASRAEAAADATAAVAAAEGDGE